jgi:glycosyltransferase involved in cell wall biosynthesis
MKILFVGVLDVEWSTNCPMKRALGDLGHTVVDFNYRAVVDRNSIDNKLLGKWVDKLASFLRSGKIPLQLSWYFKRNGRSQMNHLLLEQIKKGRFDLVFLSKTDTVDYHLLTEINNYSPTWYFFMDPMDQACRINAKAYAARATWASATFSDVTEYFKKAGAKTYWITQGVNTDVFKPQENAKVYDVVFVGTKTTKRLRYIKTLRKAEINVVCFGQGWENAPVYQQKLADIYSKSRIVLNFCRQGTGFSIRVFQVMGTGAFLLSEYCSDLECFFKAGEHMDWFQDDAELVDKAVYYLKNAFERQQIAAQGSDYVNKNYSWKKIMESILNIASSL